MLTGCSAEVRGIHLGVSGLVVVQPLEQPLGLAFDEDEGAVRCAEEAFVHHVVEDGEEGVVETGDVQEAAGLFVLA